MKRIVLTAALAATFAGLASCKKGEEKKSIKVSGSNTMAQVATAWAEKFTSAKVSVAGGGSGIGINELTEGRIDICTSSRPIPVCPARVEILTKTLAIRIDFRGPNDCNYRRCSCGIRLGQTKGTLVEGCDGWVTEGLAKF